VTRALLIVLDSVGVGGAPDAARFGDEGADTLGHVAETAAAGRADRAGLRAGPLALPNLDRLGLGAAAELATGRLPPGLGSSGAPQGLWGTAAETSSGKDTVSGHWEIAGCPVPFEWGYFPRTVPAFPPDLVAALVAEAELPGILGDRHASGTGIIAELGAEHLRTGRPICYTSADSVFQVAAHETAFGLERLYRVCEIARRLVDPLNIGRVIARPFVGTPEAGFERTANRRDLAVAPPGPTLLDAAVAGGRRVFGVGKIADIFAHRGVTDIRKADGNEALFGATLAALAEAGPGDLVFTNLVDFDQIHGHRRDPAGYAAALEAFDRRLPELERRLRPGDLCILTADHGCDPTWPGTDHTREQVPVLAFGPGLRPRAVGRRATYADTGASLAAHLGLAPLGAGRSFL